jgi:hypothetical protein
MTASTVFLTLQTSGHDARKGWGSSRNPLICRADEHLGMSAVWWPAPVT